MEEKELGTLIKEARIKQNKTLKELASEIGVEPSTLQKYESGAIKNIPYDKLKKISSVTNTSLLMATGLLGGVLGATLGLSIGAISAINNLANENDDDLKNSLNNLISFFKNPDMDFKRKKEVFEILQDEYFKSKFK